MTGEELKASSMMTKFLWIFSMAAILVQCDAYAAIREGPCEDPVSGEVHQVGDTFYPAGRCESWTCVKGNLQQMMVEIYGCGLAFNSDPGCRPVSNPHLRYPDCCTQYVCA